MFDIRSIRPAKPRDFTLQNVSVVSAEVEAAVIGLFQQLPLAENVRWKLTDEPGGDHE